MMWVGYGIAFLIGVLTMYIFRKREIGNESKVIENKNRNIAILNQWIILQHENMPLSETLKNRGVDKVAIYGMGILGRHLVRELARTDIKIAYALDRRSLKKFKETEVYQLGSNLPQVDIVINTVLAENSEIAENIHKYMSCDVLHLEDLVFESYTMKEEDNGNRY